MTENTQSEATRPSLAQKKARILAWGVIGTISGTMLVVLVLVLAFAALAVAEVRSTQKDITRTLEQIEDCTEVGGECYTRAKRQTAQAVIDLSDVSVLAAACADKPREQTIEEIYDCVRRGISRMQGEKP